MSGWVRGLFAGDAFRVPEEGLSRRPVKRAASQQVDMQVEHRLPRPGAVVDYGAIALRFQSSLTRQLSRQKKKVAQQGLVFSRGLPERDNMPSWKDQQMNGCLRMNILDRHRLLVLMHEFGRNLAIDNLAEEAISH